MAHCLILSTMPGTYLIKGSCYYWYYCTSTTSQAQNHINVIATYREPSTPQNGVPSPQLHPCLHLTPHQRLRKPPRCPVSPLLSFPAPFCACLVPLSWNSPSSFPWWDPSPPAEYRPRPSAEPSPPRLHRRASFLSCPQRAAHPIGSPMRLFTLKHSNGV